MARTKEKEVDVGRLCAAMRSSRHALRKFREERREAVRQYVGNHWSEEGTKERVFVNLLSLYVSVLGRQLIAKNPRVMLSTFQQAHKPVVSAMQAWANQEMEHMQLAGTLQRVVLDALFSLGVCKVALATPAESSLFNWRLAAGAPFCARVDLDDFVYDIHARDFAEASYVGHRYRVPLDVIRDSPLYTKARKGLTASRDEPFNLEGDERVKQLGQQYVGGSAEEFEDYVDLWEVYLPRHRLVLTLADEDLGGAAASGPKAEALRVQNWLGPEQGPYHFLGLGVVPGNAMPKAPIQDLVDMAELYNKILRKLARQAERQKENVWVGGGSAEDGSRVIQAEDGEAIRVDHQDALKSVERGGPNPRNQAFAELIRTLFSWGAGNLEMMGGLSPQSKTATQDELLAQNASKAVSDMQDRAVTFTAGVVKALCWYWHHDPFKVMKSKHNLPGLPEFAVTRQVRPAQRQQVPFEDMDIRVDPYSMMHSTPQSRLQALNSTVTQIVLPMMQLLVQQGVAFDINAYLAKVGEYLDMPDLAELLTIRPPPGPEMQGGAGGGAAPGPGPAQTTRRYVRENMPGRTPQGDTMNRINSLMGIKTGGNPESNGAVVQ